MPDLEQLAMRVEAASGPDRGLDCLIALAVFPASAEVGINSPRFTASLDAAMTLVPEGYRLQLSEWDDEEHLRARGPWQAILSKAGSRGRKFDPAFIRFAQKKTAPAEAEADYPVKAVAGARSRLSRALSVVRI